jgi:hypothetical protein
MTCPGKQENDCDDRNSRTNEVTPMHAHPINSSNQDIQGNEYRFLLGKPIAEAISILDEPFGSYPYRGREVFMFSGTSGVVNIEVKNGYVVSVNASKERRGDVRVKPDRKQKAVLRYSGKHRVAEIIDLSVKGVSMKVADGTLPVIGAAVTFCTGLRTLRLTQVYISLSGKVYRVEESSGKIVILFSSPFETHSHKVLTDYISSRQALAILRPVVPQPSYATSQSVDQAVSYIKSDLCAMCSEKVCELISGNAVDSDLPIHKGITSDAV